MQKEGLALIRMSTLRNIPVLCGERKIGLFQGVCFDSARKRVCALVISCGLKGKRLAMSKQVCSLSEEFILIDGWSQYRSSENQQPMVFARDTTGLLVGCVTDYAIDRRTLEILAVEITPGYLTSERNRRFWLYTYHPSAHPDEFSIPCGFA